MFRKLTVYIIILTIINKTIQQTPTSTTTSTSTSTSIGEPAACSQFNVNTDLILASSIISGLRAAATSSFASFRDTIIQFINTNDVSVFLSNYTPLLPYLIPIGFILVVSLLSLIWFIVCCSISICKSSDGSNESDKKNFGCWCFISFILLILLAVGLVLFFIYLRKFVVSVQLLNCSFKRIPYNFLNGIPRNNTQGIVFVGLNTLDNSFNSLKSNIGQLQSVNSNFNNILGQNLSQKTAAALTQYNTSLSALSSQQAFNPQSEANEAPLTITNISTIFNPVKLEIDGLTTISNSIDESARLVTTTFNASSTDQFTTIINTAQSQITNLTSQVTNIFNVIDISAYEYYINIIIYSALGFCISIIVILFINMLIAYCIHYKDSCRITILPSFLTLLLSLFDLILTAFMAGMFGIFLFTAVFCGTFNDFLNGQIPQLETALGATADSFIGKALRTCIYSTGDGNLNNIIQIDTSSQLNEINRLVDGISTIGNRFSEFNNITTSQAIPRIIIELNKYKNQTQNDFVQAVAVLQTLNGLNCAQTVAFTPESCGAGNTCLVISTLTAANFSSTGNCSDQTQADALFVNLKRYYDSDLVVLNNIETQLNNINPSINTIYSSFSSINSDITQIRSTLSQFISDLSLFTNGLFKSLDCRVLNYSLREFETSLCFNLSYYSFPLFLVLIIVAYLLCLINCSIYYLFNNTSYKKKSN